MSKPHDKTIALNVRLKPSDSSAHPRAANYTNVAMAQGMAYLDFGFIEPPARLQQPIQQTLVNVGIARKPKVKKSE